MNAGARCQLPPPAKYWSGFHTLPALSVLGGPLYPANSRIAEEAEPGWKGTEAEGAALFPAVAAVGDAFIRKYIYIDNASSTTPAANAKTLQVGGIQLDIRSRRSSDSDSGVSATLGKLAPDSAADLCTKTGT